MSNALWPPTSLIKIIFAILIGASPALAAIHLDPGYVRPWNAEEKKQFPSPLAAVFQYEGKSLIFVGDQHVDQNATFQYVDAAIKTYSPEVIVVEGLDFSEGKNPEIWMSRVASKPLEDLLKEPGAAGVATKLAIAQKIPVMGGEPTIEESMQSPFLHSKGFNSEDILNVQILQRIPYRRDILQMKNPDDFFDYAMKLYRVKSPKAEFKDSFFRWYKKRTSREFNYSEITKSEVAVNCKPDDTFLQNVACAFNVNRDRELVMHIEKLLASHHRVMVVYGTGHFVQEYPALLKAFGAPPTYLMLGK